MKNQRVSLTYAMILSAHPSLSYKDRKQLYKKQSTPPVVCISGGALTDDLKRGVRSPATSLKIYQRGAKKKNPPGESPINLTGLMLLCPHLSTHSCRQFP